MLFFNCLSGCGFSQVSNTRWQLLLVVGRNQIPSSLLTNTHNARLIALFEISPWGAERVLDSLNSLGNKQIQKVSDICISLHSQLRQHSNIKGAVSTKRLGARWVQQGEETWHFCILLDPLLLKTKKPLAPVQSIQHFTHEKKKKPKQKNVQSFQNMLFCYLQQP